MYPWRLCFSPGWGLGTHIFYTLLIRDPPMEWREPWIEDQDFKFMPSTCGRCHLGVLDFDNLICPLTVVVCDLESLLWL